MSRSTYWILWTVTLVVINLFVFPLATLTTEEGAGIISKDTLSMLMVILLCNIVTVQLFLAARKEDQQQFTYGLVVAGIFVLSMVFIWQKLLIQLAIILLVLSILAASILLVIALFVKRT